MRSRELEEHETAGREDIEMDVCLRFFVLGDSLFIYVSVYTEIMNLSCLSEP